MTKKKDQKKDFQMLRGLSHRAMDTHQTLQVTKNLKQVGRQRQNSNAMEKEEDLCIDQTKKLKTCRDRENPTLFNRK